MKEEFNISRKWKLQMEYIDKKLHNDISALFYPEFYLINQEGDINCQNTFNKPRARFFRDFIDGGKVVKSTKKYNCYYTYDLKCDEKILLNKRLYFTTYSGLSGDNLLDFVSSVLNGNPDIFTKIENYVFYDVRKCLFDVAEINISNTIVDDLLLKTIKKYFHRLEKISFYDCVIKNECNFNNIKVDMIFTSSVIENIRSFNDCEAPINFNGSHIVKMVPTTIKSTKFQVMNSLMEDVNVKELFLKCNFPNLKDIDVTAEDGYSYEDAFIYLPDSAPNLENINIMGKVKDLNFLTKFKYLYGISILSVSDDIGLFSIDITDGSEREKIYKRNKKQFEIEKILYPNEEEKFLLAGIEAARIKRLSHFLSRIYYTEDDKIFKKDVIKELSNKPIEPAVPYYYECWYDTLKRIKQSDITFSRDLELYHFYNNYLCVCNPNLWYRTSNQIGKKTIVKSVPFLYAANGLPIVFKSNYKPVDTIEEAMKKVENGYYGNDSLADSGHRDLENKLKRFANSKNETVSASTFFETLNQLAWCDITVKDLLSYGPVGRKIYNMHDVFDRTYDRSNNIESKIDKYRLLYNKTIMDYYDLFTLEEKLYIYNDSDYMHRYKIYNPYYKETNTDDSILESINLKTNGMYSKYYNYIKCFTDLKRIDPYQNIDIDINTSDIKKMVLYKD